MTEQQAINRAVETANGEVGYREEANNWNKYAAELDPMKITYGNKQNLPWCGEFILWIFVKCFGVDNGLKMLCSPKPTGIPLCATAAQYFKNAGRWTNIPAVGNIVFFNYDGGINHTGVVTGVFARSITTVEGNSSDKVWRNTYATSNSRIAGYGIPLWSTVAQSATVPNQSEKPTSSSETPNNSEVPVSQPIDTSATEKLPLLRYGCKGNTVKAAQILLRGWDCSVGIWGADGDFGNGTKNAVLAFQRRNGLDADGVIGKMTWAKLLGIISGQK